MREVNLSIPAYPPTWLIFTSFRQLCTGEHNGLSYATIPFHRIINEFMIQGGDIDKQDGSGTLSIYDTGEFEDENLGWREMDAVGLVCSANRGKDTNGSQFFVTLVPCEHLNGKHTIFGRLVSGQDVLEKIAAVDVDKNDLPLAPVLVARCGELMRGKKKTVDLAPKIADEQSSDRGRRRKSGDSDHDMDNPSESLPERRGRRQSDNIVDEGLRGRPRLRSGSRSDSRPLSTPEEESEPVTDASPTKLHKRKRSSSPSRPQTHADRVADEEDEEPRRRRSLPNQYNGGQHGARREEDRYRPSPRREDYRPAGGRNRGKDEGGARDNRRDDRGGDTWRPPHRRDRQEDDGRLDGDASGKQRSVRGGDGHDPPVKFKGRGAMKYREPGRL